MGLLLPPGVWAASPVATFTIYQAQSFLVHNYSCANDTSTVLSSISNLLQDSYSVQCSTSFSYTSPFSTLTLAITLK